MILNSYSPALNEGAARFLAAKAIFFCLTVVTAGCIFMAGCGGQRPPQQASNSSEAASSQQPALSSSHGSGGGEKTFGSFKMGVPAGWVEQTPSSNMRKGQYSLPRAEGDAADGELVVFYFGVGQGGSVEANIDRWIGQISQPDGSSSKGKAKTEKKNISGFPVTVVDVSGTYQPLMMPGAPQQGSGAGYRMMAAVVETSEGSWFFKLVGPEKTINMWSDSFHQLLSTIKKI